MNPKSGKAGKTVDPVDPEEAIEADEAEAGGVAAAKAKTVDQEAAEADRTQFDDTEKPHKKDEQKTSWIEIQLIDEADEPVPGERYRVELPDGSVDSGTLDSDGLARIEGIDPGTCKVTFPDLDKQAWEKA